MRLIFKVGLVPEPKPLSITAAADQADTPAGRWFGANLSLATVVEAATLLITIAGSMIAMHTSNATDMAAMNMRLTRLETSVTSISEKRIPELRADMITRGQYENDTRQTQQQLNQLVVGQQQIFTLMIDKNAK